MVTGYDDVYDHIRASATFGMLRRDAITTAVQVVLVLVSHTCMATIY